MHIIMRHIIIGHMFALLLAVMAGSPFLSSYYSYVFNCFCLSQYMQGHPQRQPHNL